MIVGVVLINAMIGFVQEGKAEKALEAVRAMLASRAIVLREGERHEIDADAAGAGRHRAARIRRLACRPTCACCASRTCASNEAALTGESVPVGQDHRRRSPRDAPIGDRACMAYSGTVVSFGQAHGVVVATGTAPRSAASARWSARCAALATPLTRRLDQFARQITLFILAVGLITFVYGYFVREHAGCSRSSSRWSDWRWRRFPRACRRS